MKFDNILLILIICLILFNIVYYNSSPSLEPHVEPHVEPQSKKPTKQDKNQLVIFSAPWCGHCKKAKPEFDKVILFSKQNNLNSIIISSEDSNFDEARKLHKVNSYPTIKFCKKGVFETSDGDIEYSGPRMADSILSFFKKQRQDLIENFNAEEVLNNLGETVVKTSKTAGNIVNSGFKVVGYTANSSLDNASYIIDNVSNITENILDKSGNIIENTFIDIGDIASRVIQSSGYLTGGVIKASGDILQTPLTVIGNLANGDGFSDTVVTVFNNFGSALTEINESTNKVQTTLIGK